MNIIARNKKAKHNYTILQLFEAGIILKGTEIKSLREGKINITEAFVNIKNDEAFLHNMYIPHYHQGNRNNHEEKRIRKLLLNKKEIIKIREKAQQERLAIIVTQLYIKDGRAKLEIALGKGKKLYDKRQSDKQKSVDKKLRQGDYE